MLATSIILGIWLVVAPFILGFSGTALWTNLILGAAVALLALLSNLGKGRFYAIAAIGLFLAVTALFAGGGALLWNGLIVGVILAYLGYQAGGSEGYQARNHEQNESLPRQPHH